MSIDLLASLAIMGIAAGIAFLNSGINRVLINYFIGWEQYRVMQKEMSEYRSETMAAMRANDKKQVEKLKKKDSQIKNMQAKMMKPQLVQFGISFVYLIVWFLVLTPTFHSTPLAFIPGIGTIANAQIPILANGAPVFVDGVQQFSLVPNAIPVFYLYPIFSLFFGLLSSRIIGIMPIEQGAI
ncbi:MAG TPA: EMC3/TMCO1 family protein [Candidatus Bathyarchaeia archaeon]